MKRGTIRSRTKSGAFSASHSPAAPAASSAAGTSASRAASHPPDSAELSIDPMSPFCDPPLLDCPFELRCESAFLAAIAATLVAAAAAAAFTAVLPLTPRSLPCSF